MNSVDQWNIELWEIRKTEVLAFAQRNDEQPGMPALVKSAEVADSAAVEALLAAGTDVNTAASNGTTALMCAAANEDLELVRLLLARGADINAATNDGVTSLTLAVFFGHDDVARELIAKGANVAAIGRFLNAPELWASARGLTEITQGRKQVRSGRASEGRENSPAEDANTSISLLNPPAPKPGADQSWIERNAPKSEGLNLPEPTDGSPARPGPPAQERVVFDSNPDASKPPEQISSASLQKPAATKPGPPRRLHLDAEILPGEASFATVELPDNFTSRTYSPVKEFRKKFNPSDSTRLIRAMLTLALVSGAIAFLVLRITGRDFSVQPVANPIAETSATPSASPSASSASPIAESVPEEALANSSQPLETPAVSEREKQANQLATSSVTEEEHLDHRIVNEADHPVTSTGVENAGLEKGVVAKSEAPPEEPRLNARQRRAVLRKSASLSLNKRAVPGKELLAPNASGDSRSKTGTTVRSQTALPEARPKQLDTQARPASTTGGEQRPRRVTSKTDLPPHGSPNLSRTKEFQ